MVRPSVFRSNEETAASNHFQHHRDGSDAEVLERALQEFDAFVELLQSHGVDVWVVQADADADVPDALFPNNWISFHDDGRVALYPMQAENRRRERREDVVMDLEHVRGFEIAEVLDFTEFEEHGRFLEGTGSLVLDRTHRKAYAALSPRTDRLALERFCEAFDFEGIAFHALQPTPAGRLPIYHTNVMMGIGTDFVAVCLDCVDDPEERELLRESLAEDGREIIALTEEQIASFAGNLLEIENGAGQALIVLSRRGFASLRSDQIEALQRHGTLVTPDLTTIETHGGGSARCMLAEIHLPLSVPE
jgi:hypothetical protein